MKTFLVRDEAAFKLRVTVRPCLSPNTLQFLEFTGEQYNDKGEMIESSSYEFFLEQDHIRTLCEGLQA